MSFHRKKTLWESGFVTPSLFGVRADNLSPLTVTGTNTFIVHEPGTPHALVVDPGPADVRHLRAVMASCADRGAEIAGIFVTHHHLDHIGGADLLRYLVSRGPDSIDPDAMPPDLDGSRFSYDEHWEYPTVTFPDDGGVPVFHQELGNCPEGPFEPFPGCPRMEVVNTPGHSYDSVSLVLRDDSVMLTGDLIFRFWSTVIPFGDGNLTDYFASLDTVQRLVHAGTVGQLVPAHGFPIDQPIKALEGYRAHRRERLAEVRRTVDAGAGFDPYAVVRGVYGDIEDELLLGAALSSTLTQLEYLAAERGIPLNLDKAQFTMPPAAQSAAAGTA